MTRKRSALLWLPAALLLTVGAEASPIGVEAPDFTVVVNETTFSSDMLGLEATGDPGDFRTVGMMARPDDWTFMWDLVVDADPIIGGTFSILNTTSSTRRFDLTFNLPIAPPLTNTQYQGLLDVTLTDADGTAIPGSSSTFAEYTNLNWFGLIDGAQVLNLAGVETGLCFGANCSVNLNTSSEGLTSYALGAQSTIGITLSFDLSPGDRLAFNTNFEVIGTVVPVPGAALLLISGLAGLGAFRRRRLA